MVNYIAFILALVVASASASHADQLQCNKKKKGGSESEKGWNYLAPLGGQKYGVVEREFGS